MEPIIIIDTREQMPLHFENVKSKRATLKTGDYSLLGYEHEFSIERKTVSDLVGSLTKGRPRFMAEMYRLQNFKFKRLLIIGSRAQIEKGDYRSNAHPAAILASLAVIEVRFNIPVAFVADEKEAASVVEGWSHYFMREMYGKTETRTNTPAEAGAVLDDSRGLPSDSF